MVKIILNADDFGKSVERNRAIDDSFKQGLIRSAGLIVTGKHLHEAIEYMNKGGYVESIHLHINLSANLLQEGSDDIPLSEAMKHDSFFCKDGKFKKYKGLPHKLSDIRKWKTVYHEIEAQYAKFKEITNGKADYKHIDFHLWYNLTWPVSVALRKFSKKNEIKSIRYIGVHQMSNRKFRLFHKISQLSYIKDIPAANIDYYLSKKQLFDDYPMLELYCHPNYKDGVFLDDSPSYLKHERQPMLKQIQSLNEINDIELISWEDVF